MQKPGTNPRDGSNRHGPSKYSIGKKGDRIPCRYNRYGCYIELIDGWLLTKHEEICEFNPEKSQPI
jgi:hypothetical protein